MVTGQEQTPDNSSVWIIFSLLDTVAVACAIVIGTAVFLYSSFPFSAAMGIFCLLLAAHFGFMWYSLISRSRVGYYDHFFSYLPLFFLFGRGHPWLWGPITVLLVFLLATPGFRKRFALPPLRLALFNLPEGLFFFGVILVVIGFHLGKTGTFPHLPGDLGLFNILKGKTGAVGFAATALILGIASFARFRSVFFLTPAVGLFGLVLFYPWGIPLGVLLGILWVLPATRSFFGFSSGVLPGAYVLGLLFVFLGIVFGAIPVGICHKHDLPISLYPAWKTPLLVAARKQEVIFRASQTLPPTKMQGSCPQCESAIVFRLEAAACRKARTDLANVILEALGSQTWTEPRILLDISRDSMRLDPALAPARESIQAAADRLLRFPCPYAEKMPDHSGLSRYTFVVSGTESELESTCWACEKYGL